ncbi:hypothetical protein [Vibrio marisflavi]|uniref:Uncharacterized protein n=1 Tax=Vibrio marisflavi CECT 7928 TaxID=634439 RepID=A0ABN8E0Q6_9VIBR|nr:hypothetical protein [Vibrio marisflavi]CAH0537821.1 hypothetical protein VMF7928_01374 [Vibrio marisflavi CECT 7928]
MLRSTKLRNGTLAVVILGLIAPSIALAEPRQPYKYRKPAKNVVVVKPIYRPNYKVPAHRRYYYTKVPKHASYIVLAGITYAIIDNIYYKRSGNEYVYVEQPPVTVVKEVNTATAAPTNQPKVGTVIDFLPDGTVPVSVSGSTFYVKQSHWYAPIAGTNKFVVVEPQL